MKTPAERKRNILYSEHVLNSRDVAAGGSPFTDTPPYRFSPQALAGVETNTWPTHARIRTLGILVTSRTAQVKIHGDCEDAAPGLPVLAPLCISRDTAALEVGSGGGVERDAAAGRAGRQSFRFGRELVTGP